MHVLPRRRWRILAELGLVLAIAIVATSVFARAPAKQAGDEANWLGTARFFLVLFVHHDVAAESWPDSYWTRTQPMVPRYIMGGWLWARGYDYEGLDPNYDHRRKWFSNEREGKAPSEAILAEARVPMRGLTVLAALLLYGVVRVVAGPIGGAAAALLFCGSPYLTLHMVRAMGEPPFIVFLLATMLVSLIAIEHGGARGPGIGWGVLAGILLGFAFSSKLTAIIAILAVVLWGVWAVLGGVLMSRLPALARRPDGAPVMTALDGPETVGAMSPPSLSAPGPSAGARSLLWALGVVAIALLTFVATNPFLYRDPISRTVLLFQNRQTEMTAQAELDPSRAVTGLAQRVTLVWTNSLVEDTWADSRLHLPLEATLAVIGLAWLFARAVRPGAEALVLLCVVGFFGGVTAGLGYVLDHYFVPTATMGLVLDGLTVGWGARLAWSSAVRLWRRRGHVLAQREAAVA